MARPTAQHGKPYLAKVKGCKCEPCRESLRAYYRQYRKTCYERTSRGQAPPASQVPHSRYRYSAYGCRCQICYEAMAVVNQQQRERRARCVLSVATSKDLEQT